MADYKFEIVANEFLTNSDSKSAVFVKRRGGFQRSYSKEIADIQISESPLNDGKILNIELNQDGIFDHLPEELFHHQSRHKQQEQLSFAQKHRNKKEEEKNSRAFFQPFENEFSSLLILLESYEKNLMDNNNDSEQVYSFFDDLSEKSNLKVSPSAKLNFFYPLLPYFRGDLKFLRYVLVSILLKPVSIQVISPNHSFNQAPIKEVGQIILGSDSCLGKYSEDKFDLIEITIHELHAKDTSLYLPEGESHKIIKLLTQMILPIQTDYTLTLEYSLREGQIQVGGEGNLSILGYNSYIH